MNLSTSIWRYVKDYGEDIKEVLEKVLNGLLRLKKTYNISNINAENDYPIVFETSNIDKYTDVMN